MRARAKVSLLLALAATGWVAAAPVEDKFHLKTGAKGKVCLGCHTDFEDKLKLPSVHTPVTAG